MPSEIEEYVHRIGRTGRWIYFEEIKTIFFNFSGLEMMVRLFHSGTGRKTQRFRKI